MFRRKSRPAMRYQGPLYVRYSYHSPSSLVGYPPYHVTEHAIDITLAVRHSRLHSSEPIFSATCLRGHTRNENSGFGKIFSSRSDLSIGASLSVCLHHVHYCCTTVLLYQVVLQLYYSVLSVVGKNQLGNCPRRCAIY